MINSYSGKICSNAFFNLSTLNDVWEKWNYYCKGVDVVGRKTKYGMNCTHREKIIAAINSMILTVVVS